MQNLWNKWFWTISASVLAIPVALVAAPPGKMQVQRGPSTAGKVRSFPQMGGGNGGSNNSVRNFQSQQFNGGNNFSNRLGKLPGNGNLNAGANGTSGNKQFFNNGNVSNRLGKLPKSGNLNSNGTSGNNSLPNNARARSVDTSRLSDLAKSGKSAVTGNAGNTSNTIRGTRLTQGSQFSDLAKKAKSSGLKSNIFSHHDDRHDGHHDDHHNDHHGDHHNDHHGDHHNDHHGDHHNDHHGDHHGDHHDHHHDHHGDHHGDHHDYHGDHHDHDHHHHHHHGHKYRWWPWPVVVAGPVVRETFVQQVPVPVAVPVANNAVVEQPVPAKELDVELVDVRVVNPGDLEFKVGPRFRVKLRNNGETAVKKFSVTLVATGEGDENSPTASKEVASLAPGKEIEVDVRLPVESLTLTRDAQGKPAPFAKLVAAVDSTELLEETDEENNVQVFERTELKMVGF